MVLGENDYTYGKHEGRELVSLNTLEDLIVEWARTHSPTRQTSRQYRSVLFYGDDMQKEIAQDALRGLSQKYIGSSVKLYVDIEKWTKFYQAEEYHQHYLKKKGMDYG